MKKITSMLIASAMLLSMLTACSNENKPAATTPTGNTTNPPQTSANESNTTTAAPSDTTNGEQAADSTVNKIAQKIKDSYGENYLPSMPMDNEMINTTFGLEEGSYTEAFAEMPMISAHPDTLLIVKAAEGKTDDVKKKIEEYRQRLLDDTMQYPMNLPKIQASQVVQNGDIIAFIVLGAVNEDLDASEEDQAKFAEEQEKIGVDAFNAYFG